MPIEVLIICTTLNEKGAAFRRIHFFIKYLIRRGFNTMCLGFPSLSINGVAEPSKFCLRAPILLVSTRFQFITYIVNTILGLFFIPYLIVLKPEVIVLSVPEYYPLIPVYLASKLLGAKLIIDFRDPREEVSLRSSVICGRLDKFFMEKVTKKVNYALYRRADTILTVTETARSMLENSLGVRVFVAPNGADLEVFKPINRGEARKYFQLKDDDFVIVYTGRIGGYYKFTKVLKVLKKLMSKSAGRTIKLLAAGPILDKTYRSILLEREDPGAVYLGVLDLDKLKILYSAADIGLVSRVDDPAFDYALPAKFYEYIAMGLPVLALCRRESELARTIIENELGFVCEPSDEECIEHAIKTLALNPEIYDAFRENVLKYRKLIDRRISGAVLTAILKYLAKH